MIKSKIYILDPMNTAVWRAMTTRFSHSRPSNPPTSWKSPGSNCSLIVPISYDSHSFSKGLRNRSEIYTVNSIKFRRSGRRSIGFLWIRAARIQKKKSWEPPAYTYPLVSRAIHHRRFFFFRRVPRFSPVTERTKYIRIEFGFLFKKKQKIITK